MAPPEFTDVDTKPGDSLKKFASIPLDRLKFERFRGTIFRKGYTFPLSFLFPSRLGTSVEIGAEGILLIEIRQSHTPTDGG